MIGSHHLASPGRETATFALTAHMDSSSRREGGDSLLDRMTGVVEGRTDPGMWQPGSQDGEAGGGRKGEHQRLHMKDLPGDKMRLLPSQAIGFGHY